jgi:hypothetical protein
VGTPNPLGNSVTSSQSDWQTADSQIVDLFSELSTFVLLSGRRGSHFVSRVLVERGTGVDNSTGGDASRLEKLKSVENE